MDQLAALVFGALWRNPLDIFQPEQVINIGGHSFTVVGVIGVGGCGVVYKCSSAQFGRVCVKVTRATNLSQDELQFMLQLQPVAPTGPNLLPLLAHSTIDHNNIRLQLLCIPFVAGGAVGHKRQREPDRFTEGVVKAILYDVACGLAVLHENNILHGDVSPLNILLERWDAFEVGDTVVLNLKAVLCDFGISRRLQGDGTTAVRGYHPVFSAPEVVNGIATRAADVWSLGATMVHLLYGVNGNFLENAARVKCVALRTILQRCLSDLDHRYADAQALWGAGLEKFRWNTAAEERLPLSLKELFVEVYRAKQAFWMGFARVVDKHFRLIINPPNPNPNAQEAPLQA